MDCVVVNARQLRIDAGKKEGINKEGETGRGCLNRLLGYSQIRTLDPHSAKVFQTPFCPREGSRSVFFSTGSYRCKNLSEVSASFAHFSEHSRWFLSSADSMGNSRATPHRPQRSPNWRTGCNFSSTLLSPLPNLQENILSSATKLSGIQVQPS